MASSPNNQVLPADVSQAFSDKTDGSGAMDYSEQLDHLWAEHGLYYSFYHPGEYDAADEKDAEMDPELDNSVGETCQTSMLTSTPKPLKENVPLMFGELKA